MQLQVLKLLLFKVRFFLLPLLVILIACLFYDSHYSEVSIFLHINEWNSIYSDYLFKGITLIGSGLTYILLIILFYYLDKHFFYLAGISFAATALVTQLLKRLVFPGLRRPAGIINHASHLIHHIAGVTLYSQHSFPSGHTATSFSMFLLLTLYFRKKPFLGFLFLICACLTGYSRIYMGEHFFIDTIGGSCLGTFLTLSIIYLYAIKKYKITKDFVLAL